MREARFELADSYESGCLLSMTPCLHVILSPPPLTRLGYSRTNVCPVFFERILEVLMNSLMMFEIVVGRAGFEPATFDSDESVTRFGFSV